MFFLYFKKKIIPIQTQVYDPLHLAFGGGRKNLILGKEVIK